MKTINNYQLVCEGADEVKKQLFRQSILFVREAKEFITKSFRKRTSIRKMLPLTTREESLNIVAHIMRVTH